MTLSVSPALKLAYSQAAKARIDQATAPAYIEYYAAPRGTGALLATCTLSKPCGTSTSNSTSTQLTLTTPATGQASATGIITWARLFDGAGVSLITGDVREPTASDVTIADFIIDVAQVYTGGYVNLLSAVLTEGG